MINSMTGFGQAQAQKNGERFVVTLKSVNHRYFETAFHLPPGFDYLEAVVRSMIGKKVQRGRISVSVSHVNESQDVIVLNQALLRSYFKALEEVRGALKISRSVEIGDLMTLPGVWRTQKKELKGSERATLVQKALREALRKMLGLRRREGAALAADLRKRVARIAAHMATVRKVQGAVIEEKKKTLTLEELESFLRSTDVGEEMTRIDFHLKSFLKQMTSAEPKGKVLDFIGQELQREVNTLGAKVQEKNVAFQVVMIKDQIEKIREQVQNVE